MKRKKAFAIGSAAVVLAAAAVLFGLWVAGIQTLGTTIDIRPCDAASLQEHMDYYRSVENGSVSVSSEQLFNNEDPFPSDDPADYRDVYIRADVKNYSCFKKSISEARLFISPAEQTGVIMTNGSPVTTWVDAFQRKTACLLRILCITAAIKPTMRSSGNCAAFALNGCRMHWVKWICRMRDCSSLRENLKYNQP